MIDMSLRALSEGQFGDLARNRGIALLAGKTGGRRDHEYDNEMTFPMDEQIALRAASKVGAGFQN